MTLIESDQSKDIRLTQIARGPFLLRYASYRKGEDAKLGLQSEDYIVSELTPERAIFGLCDGVGSSYYGNIGSQFLGETLFNWLGNLSAPNNSDFTEDKNIHKWLDDLTVNLKSELDSKIDFANRVIQNRSRINQNELIQLAEKTQLEDFGTQSNFVGGIIWPPKPHGFQNGLIFLFWLGNARLRIFKKSDENRVEELTHLTKWGQDPAQIKEVWSSKEGVVGNLHSYLTDFSRITSIIAYSDGMEGVEEEIKPDNGGGVLETLIRKAQSIKDDDVSYLEISLSEVSNNQYSDDIVESVRKQYVDTNNNVPPLEYQYEVQKLRKELQKSKQQILDFEKTKKKFLFLIIILMLLATSIFAILGYLIGTLGEDEMISTPTSISTPTTFPPFMLLPTTSSLVTPASTQILDNISATPQMVTPTAPPPTTVISPVVFTR